MAVKKVKVHGRTMWRARVRRGGKTRTAFRKRRDEALEAESELLAELERGESLDLDGMPTLAEFSDVFLERACAENRPSEQAKKRANLRDHLLPAFGHLLLDQITPRLVDAYKAAKLATYKPNTVANHLAVLRRMLNVAHAWGVLDRVPPFQPVRREAPERDYLSFDECRQYLDAAGDAWRPLLLVAVRTGLRLGELRGLQWGDVDLGRRQLRVRRAFTQMGWGKPKSGHGRTVDLASDAAKTLGAIRPARAGRTALVFPGPSGKPLDEKAVYKACSRACKGADLGRVVGPHKLRHTFASHHAMRGTPLPQIQAWLGHASITTTMRYAHLCPSEGGKWADTIVPEEE